MLVNAGVPWDVAANLSPTEMLGYIVAVGEIDGGLFNWDALKWEKPT